MDYILEMFEMTIQLNNVRVLNNFTLQVKEGEFHAVIADSEFSLATILKILSGEYSNANNIGDLYVRGEIKKFNSISDSEKSGIGIIHQKPEFVEQMDISENIFLGTEIKKLGFVIERMNCFLESIKVLKEVGLNYKPTTKVRGMTTFEKQKLEMARLLAKKSSIWVLEDPSNILSDKEISNMVEILAMLKSKRITVIYLGHRLKDILKIADKVTIMREGKDLLTEDARSYFDEDIEMSLMVGKELSRSEFIDSFCSAYDISKREKDVLLLLLNGCSNREICLELFLSVNTIKTHISNIYQKTKMGNRIELANLILKFKKH